MIPREHLGLDMDRIDAPPAGAGQTSVAHAHLKPPIQVVVRCPACGYERASAALHAQMLAEVLRCERCREPNEVLSHRSLGGPACPTCCPV
jgi:hypothetical protein